MKLFFDNQIINRVIYYFTLVIYYIDCLFYFLIFTLVKNQMLSLINI